MKRAGWLKKALEGADEIYEKWPEWKQMRFDNWISQFSYGEHDE